jgi:PEP-CTERM motif
MKKFALLAATALMAVSSSAYAAGLKVLVLGHESSTTVLQNELNDIIGSDVRFDLMNSGVFDGVSSGIPTLSFISQFNSVLVSTNFVPSNGTGLSDLLADYVDAGGGVVLSTFWGQEVPNVGRLNTVGYNPLIGATTNAYNSQTLGSFNAADPLMQGVTSLSSVFYNGDYLGVDAGATLAASWASGRPLAAYNAAHNVAYVSLYPNVAQYGHATGDYRRLFANALAFTGSPSVGAVPEPASWALMIAGFGLVGSAMRRRKPSVSVSYA